MFGIVTEITEATEVRTGATETGTGDATLAAKLVRFCAAAAKELLRLANC